MSFDAPISCDTVCETIMATLRIPQLPRDPFNSVDHGTLSKAKAQPLPEAMLVRVTKKQQPKNKKKRKEKLATVKQLYLANKMSTMKPSDVWKIAVQRGVDEKTAANKISKEMAKPDEETVRLTIPVQLSPTQQWATTADDVEEVWHNVKKSQR